MDGLIALVYARKLYDLAEGPQGPPGQDGEVTNAALEEKLEAYAKLDGSYANMTVGNAEQLVSNVRVNDKTPYLFRTSGGSVDIGDREYVNGIVGGTVAWNQLIVDPLLTDSSKVSARVASVSLSGGVATVTPTSDGTERGGYFKIGIPLIAGHKYLLRTYMKVTTSGTIRIGNNGGFVVERPITSGSWQLISGIITSSTDSANPNASFYQKESITTSDTLQYKTPLTFDLTQMFGSTIADYIYSLEQSNAGAGVAWFKKYFPKPYYAYNSGTLKHVEGLVSHDMNGFNQFDKSTATDNAYVNGSGVISPSPEFACSDYIRCIPNTVYYTNADVNGRIYPVVFFDADKNFIDKGTIGDVHKFTTLANAYYFRINIIKSALTVDELVVNLHWDGSRNGEYEPYVKHSYSLDSDVVLRGIPKLDANNNLYYDGDVYEADGTVTRKYGIVDLGALEWTLTTIYYTSNGISTLVKKPADSSVCVKAIAQKYHVVHRNGTDNTDDLAVDGSGKLFVRNTTTTPTGYLVYELATPTTESADPYTSPQIVNDFGTEEFAIDDAIDVPIPVGNNTDYPIDLKAKVEMAPNSPDGDGDYIVRQVNGENSYVPLVIEDALPTIPSTDGTYKLTVTVADGADPVLSWEAE